MKMRAGDVLLFSPDYELSRLITAEPTEIADQLERRVEGFYLGPADLLNRRSHSFAAGVLCFGAVDAIARYEVASGYSSDRFKRWISKLPDFRELPDEDLDRVYDDFRDGLLHEGRIRRAGQFTYKISEAVHVENGVALINPRVLVGQIRAALKHYVEETKSDRKKSQLLARAIMEDFDEHFKLLPP
jgi:hypothetical protein